MDLEAFDAWLRRYFEAWGSNEGAAVAELFAEDALYFVEPFGGPRMRGRAEIVQQWTSDPDAQRDVRWEYEPIAVVGRRGVAHWRVSFAPDGLADRRVELDGILLIDFDDAGRCTEHREWYLRREVPAV